MWIREEGHDEYHVCWILRNDKKEVLAQIEGFCGEETDLWYPWAMDPKNVDIMRRLGPSCYKRIETVKIYCEMVIAGDVDISKLKDAPTIGRWLN